uniref:Uncharacterized protein n=1 Tax=Anguilla anguilla TaxID=7936 RepID=A0A0E9PXE9_ANGAN
MDDRMLFGDVLNKPLCEYFSLVNSVENL